MAETQSLAELSTPAMPDSLFNPLDCIVLALCLISAIFGFRRRLSGEIANVLGFVFATIMLISFMGLISGTIASHTSLSPRASVFASYMVVFVVTLILVYLIARFLGGLMQITVTKGVDHFLGAFAGLLRALIIMYIVIVGLLACPIGTLSQNTATGSFSGALVQRTLPLLVDEFEKWQEREKDDQEMDESPPL